MPDQITAILRGLLGLFVLVAVCWACSTNRRRVSWQLVITGIVLQIVFAVCTLHVPLFRDMMEAVANFFVKTLDFAGAGAELVFGGLYSDKAKFGFIFAFNVLPTIVFFSALTSALYYLGILQKIVFVIAWVMSKTMKLSGAESLSAAANIFVGQTEAPLLIKPFIEKMTRSEILCIMVGGMATIAGGVMAAYVGMLGGESVEGRQLFALHLLTASILSAPAAVVASKLLLPETETVDTRIEISRERLGSNLLDALVLGTSDGLKLALNVAAMLLAFTAVVALANYAFSGTINALGGDFLNTWASTVSDGRFKEFNLQFLLGLGFAPVAWLIGVPSGDLLMAGQLLGEKTILNEFVAYTSMANLKTAGTLTNQTTIIVLTYALCGFSNFVSIGIQIGGISSLAPGQRENLANLGWRALLGGTVACLMTACVALMVT